MAASRLRPSDRGARPRRAIRRDDGITVWASTQKAHDLYQTLTALLDLDENRLRVATPDVGGGFGPKLCVYPEDVAVTAAAKLLKRSLKWIEDRREHFINAAQERDQYWTIEIAVDDDARILGVRGKLFHDLGAYALQDVNLPYNSASMMPGPYMCPRSSMDVVVAATNKTPVSSVRGAGYPQATFAMERLMDRVARELKLDRAEVRRRNLIPPEKMPYTKPLKARSGATMHYDSGDYPACQAELLQAAGWDDFPQRQAAARARAAISASAWRTASRAPAAGRSSPASCGSSKPGTCRCLPARPRSGRASAPCSRRSAPPSSACTRGYHRRARRHRGVSLGLGAFASRQTVTAGSSVLLAARAVAAKAKKLASMSGGGRARSRARGRRGARRRRAGAFGHARRARAHPARRARLWLSARHRAWARSHREFRTDSLAYANACHVPRSRSTSRPAASRSCATSRCTIPACSSIPMMVEGQMRARRARHRQRAIRMDGLRRDRTAGPPRRSPTICCRRATEVADLSNVLQGVASPLNPLGAKGAGEVGTIPTAAAVISAIEDALEPFGVRIAQMPITPPKLLELIADGAKA